MEHVEIIKVLAPFTDNPNAPDSKGWTPINVAAKNNHEEVIKLITSSII